MWSVGFFCLFVCFFFQQLVLYVSVAVTGIYKVSIAYTPYRYMFLKTKAVYLVVKTPKLWKMIRGNHKAWLVFSLCFSFCFFCRFSWSLAVFSKSSAHIIGRLTGWGFVISPYTTIRQIDDSCPLWELCCTMVCSYQLRHHQPAVSVLIFNGRDHCK